MVAVKKITAELIRLVPGGARGRQNKQVHDVPNSKLVYVVKLHLQRAHTRCGALSLKRDFKGALGSFHATSGRTMAAPVRPTSHPA
jgi:hypothetical protein